MKSIYKYVLLIVSVLSCLLVVSLYWNNGQAPKHSGLSVDTGAARTFAEKNRKDKIPSGSTSLDLDSPFDYGIFQGVGSVQIELAMSQRRLPPIRPVLKDPDAPLDSMKQILIISYWRAGSSFLGELIHSSPGVFYSYEPLHFLNESARIHSGNKQAANNLIQSIFRCEFSADYLKHISGVGNHSQCFMSTNRRVWQSCTHDRTLCTRSDFVRRLCVHFPVQLMKTVRLPLQLTRQIIEDLPDLKIVYLIRDPRGIMASRANLSWCKHPTCRSASELCQQMTQDLKTYRLLSQEYPNRIYFLKFEDLSSNVHEETTKLFHFLGMNVTLPVQIFLKTHTNSSTTGNSTDPYSTQRQSKLIATAWRNKLPPHDISIISSMCDNVLQTCHYPRE